MHFRLFVQNGYFQKCLKKWELLKTSRFQNAEYGRVWTGEKTLSETQTPFSVDLALNHHALVLTDENTRKRLCGREYFATFLGI